MNKQMEMLYRQAAVQGATQIGLTIALYDRLAGDLQRAASTVRVGDIEGRCHQLHHAYMVLGRLESWVDAGSDNALAASLTTFYGFLRAKMMEASLKQSADLLDNLVELVLAVRSTWQQKESELARANSGSAPASAVGDSVSTLSQTV